ERGPGVIVARVQALMQAVPGEKRLGELARAICVVDDHPPERLIEWLGGAGYNRIDTIEEPGDFAVRGGIIDIFPAGARDDESATPVRLDFFGDEVETIREIDLNTMGSDRRVDRVDLIGADPRAIASDEGTANVLELLGTGTWISVLHEPIEVTEQARGYYERVTDARGIFGPPAVFKLLQEESRTHLEVSQFVTEEAGIELPVRPLEEFARSADEAVVELASLSHERKVVLYANNDGERKRLGELVAEFAPQAEIEIVSCYLHRGFLFSDDLALVPAHELLHRYQTRRRIRKLKAGKGTEAFLELEVGDFVVHQDHGIAKFVGLRTMSPKQSRGGDAAKEADRVLREHAKDPKKKRAKASDTHAMAEEYLTLEFAGRAKLHVPVTQIDRVQKYIGGGKAGTGPKLSTIGGKRWQTEKDRVRESVRDLAAEMLRVQAARSSMPGVRYPSDTAWQKEFEAEFPYEETEDQLAALSEIKKDMGGSQPMDRLLCGDVGYGKTEVAIRAAFKAAEFGKQVAVLVPTTLLCEQHERTFRSRFADYPFRIESLSRFKTAKESNEILKGLRKGEVDIVIGTHRLLSKDVRFNDLGLVIVDEEQKFGVEDKQKLLALRVTVDVLTLSATPIPRTLHMSMLGLRDISSLSTPPMDRRAVVTEVIPYNEKRIKQALERELAREGQIFFVHNRVHDIQTVADDVRQLVPDARVVVGHGQMAERELEEVMRDFTTRRADILVSTTIIESGIDIPTANTMLIDSADMFGLAELHQLRGRVGRHKHRAYCYMLLPKNRTVNEVAVKRLRAIEEFSMLGSGFKIAMRDLEIRGAGNLLGAEQSGHIAAVGYDMYCQLLEQAAKELRGERTEKPSDTTLEIGVIGSIPSGYIPSDVRRLEAYRRIATATSPSELEEIEQNVHDAYGEPPEQTTRLIELARVRVGAANRSVRSIAIVGFDIVIRGENASAIEQVLNGVQGTVRTLTKRNDDELFTVHWRPPPAYMETETLLGTLRRRFQSS
ncbi:MAG: transcription-repair coupling factor, partial [Planctomycetota bacterium]